MKLKQLHEDKDMTLAGSREYAAATETEVNQKHSKSEAGSGVKPPPPGDVSRFMDACCPGYATDSLVPSKIHRKGQDPKVGKISI